MVISKYAVLIARLLSATRKGTINWEDTSEENVFQTSFPNHSLQITYRERFDEEQHENVVDYIIRIFNNKSKLVEEIDDISIYRDSPHISPPPFQIMEELYKSVRRRVLGVDEALDEIISSLEPEDIGLMINPPKRRTRPQPIETDDDIPF